MVPRHASLWTDIAKDIQLLFVFFAHAFFLSGRGNKRVSWYRFTLLEASCLGATRADATPELTNAEDSDKFVVSLEAASDDPY
jgi:hypothetical protein